MLLLSDPTEDDVPVLPKNVAGRSSDPAEIEKSRPSPFLLTPRFPQVSPPHILISQGFQWGNLWPKSFVHKGFGYFAGATIVAAFADCDIVVEAFDRAETKAVLLNALADSGKYIVSGCGLAGITADGIQVRQLGKNVAIAGDFSSDMEHYRLYSPKVLMVASLMALLVLQKLGYPAEK